MKKKCTYKPHSPAQSPTYFQNSQNPATNSQYIAWDVYHVISVRLPPALSRRSSSAVEQDMHGALHRGN